MLVDMINSFSLIYGILHKFVQPPEDATDILFYMKGANNVNGAPEVSKAMTLIPLQECNMHDLLILIIQRFL